METIRNEFIWHEDKFVYHLTNVAAMKGIIKSGLLPMVGDRSKMVGDNIQGIYFYYDFDETKDWINSIYRRDDIHDIELLRFNIKGLEYHTHDIDIDGLYVDHYVSNGIPRNEIEYARLYDRRTGKIQTLNSISDKSIITWSPIEKYKPINKSRSLYLSDK